jgi:hypothetical protein
MSAAIDSAAEYAPVEPCASGGDVGARKRDGGKAPPALVLAAAKVEDTVSQRIDAYLERFRKRTGMRNTTRSDVIRLAIERGLSVLEAEEPKP